MKSLIKFKLLIVLVLFAIVNKSFAGGIETNPSQYFEIGVGTAGINKSVKSQTNAMEKTAMLQGAMAAEFTIMKRWENKYNSYLKTTTGYAQAIKASTTLYVEGMRTLQRLHEIQKAISANPSGVGATIAMNTLYIETAIEFAKTYRTLKMTVARGGTENMLTGAERTELLWQLSDELARLNNKLRSLAISIAYHNLKDVWNKVTVGMASKSHKQLAENALERWKRASKVSSIITD